MHWSWLTVAMWIFRWWYSSHTIIVLSKIFTWTISAFLMFKFLSCLFFKWNTLPNISHAHLLVRTITYNSKFTHTAIKPNDIILLYLWWKSICSNWSTCWYCTHCTLTSIGSTFNQVVILVHIGEAYVFLFFMILGWIDLLMCINGTMAIFCTSLHY